MQWEYRFERINTTGMYLTDRGKHGWITPPEWHDIDGLGAEGWELVSVFGAEGSEATAVFKRPVATTEEEMRALSDSGESHLDIPL